MEKYTEKMTTGEIPLYDDNSTTEKLNVTMQLHGMPYQFLDSVDPRTPSVSSLIGRSFIQNVIIDAPILIIMPGKPSYLPGRKDKSSVTSALIAATNNNFSELQEIKNNDLKRSQLKLYDWQSAYNDCFQYINMLNRSCAAFLELNNVEYIINGRRVDFLSFDWKDYRWDGEDYHSSTAGIVKGLAKRTKSAWKKTVVGKATRKALKTLKDYNKNNKIVSSAIDNFGDLLFDDLDADPNTPEEVRDAAESLYKQMNYIQFYVDPNSGDTGTSLTNHTTPSIFKSSIDGASDSIKQIAFLANSGGIDSQSLQNLGAEWLSGVDATLGAGISSVNETAGGIISSILSTGKSVIKGENIIMPDIWTGCDMGKSHEITCVYKAPYGNRLALYMDVIVPMNYWIALSYPHATSANSYSSPYILKCYQKGGWTCNLGCITNLQINKNVVEGSRNVDGLVTEVEVRVTITELYSDMAISPANDPILFLQNSSLVEYLATTCGLNLIESQFSRKMSLLWSSTTNFVSEIPSNVGGKIMENFDRIISSFMGI